MHFTRSVVILAFVPSNFLRNRFSDLLKFMVFPGSIDVTGPCKIDEVVTCSSSIMKLIPLSALRI